MAYHVHRDESPFFAQTGQELNLDDSDIYDDEDEEDEDLRSQVGGGSSETFEMVSSTGKRREDQYAIGEGGSHSSERLVEGDYVDAGPSTSAAAGRSGRLSASSVESFQLYTPDEELTVRRKFDRKLVLFVALLYMLSFLDRSSTLRYFSTEFTFVHRRCKTNKKLQISATRASPAWTKTCSPTPLATTGTSGLSRPSTLRTLRSSGCPSCGNSSLRTSTSLCWS